MGYGMAGNVRMKMSSSGVLLIHDVVRDTCDKFVHEFKEFGTIQIVDTPEAGVNQSNTIITMVPRGVNVREVYLDGVGAVKNAAKADRVILECSTIEVQTTREVGNEIMQAGIGKYFDTPVSGGAISAKNGTLSFLIGHSEDDIPMAKRIAEVVRMMANPEKIIFCGKLGNGLGAKICNNYLSFCNMLSIAEAMSIGIRLGVDKHTLFNCIRNSGGNSATFHNFQPCPGLIPHLPSSNDFKPGFRPFMMVKDLTLAVEAGEQTGINATMAQTALETFRKAMEDPRCK
ncbi:3-hydroxyisobutyrate dehydrogenase, partial [Tolypocladium paradoxum]